MFSGALLNTTNSTATPKISVTCSTVKIYENTLGLGRDSPDNFHEFFEFNLVTLNKGNGINISITDTITGNGGVVFTVSKFLVMKME